MRRTAWGASLCVLVIFVIAASIPAYTQAVNATLVGTVTDASGAVVNGAKIMVTERATGISRASTTNESGNYVLPNLPPGSYNVSSEMQGFKKSARSGVDVTVNSTVRVDFTMQPGANGETITVN